MGLISACVVALVIAFLALVFVAYRYELHWTGLPATRPEGDLAQARPAKTAWDWLQLLVIPVVLIVLAYYLNSAQSQRDREIAADAARETTLRTYFAQMSELVLDRRLLASKAGTPIRQVARTATLTALRRTDGSRRGLIIRFLHEASLLSDDPFTAGIALDLASAELNGAELRNAELNSADLSEADLSRADLRDAAILGGTFDRADLTGADLSRASLFKADFSEADLTHANLRRASLRRLGSSRRASCKLTFAKRT